MKDLFNNIIWKFGLLTFVQFIKNKYKNFLYQKEIARIQVNWRSSNRHNHTTVGNTIEDMYFPLDRVTVGKHSYGPLCVHSFGTVGERLIIGNYCSISLGVKFILGGNHSISTFSTFPFRHFYNNLECEALTKGPIIMEDDVWIGTNSIILSGIKLSKGTIIAAGSVVTKSTIPYTIVGGNPARVIKARFDEHIISILLDIDFGRIDEKRIKNLLPKLYSPLNDEILSEIKNELLIS